MLPFESVCGEITAYEFLKRVHYLLKKTQVLKESLAKSVACYQTVLTESSQRPHVKTITLTLRRVYLSKVFFDIFCA